MTRTLTAPPSARPGDNAPAPRAGDPRWVRPALVGLLLATAVLYMWGLGASGWANSFYSAAVQAGSTSWKAFFFGSSDAANSITVDKTPASLWIMDLSARVFGVNSWSILVPQALEGVAAVGLLYAAVRRVATPAAGLLAGAALALTPVATLMFRFNNPDALLVLLLVAAAYAALRAVETAGTRWLMLAGALVGFGFLAKMLQALLVVPAFALVYLIAAPTPLRRRIWQLLLAGAAMIVSAGWWVAIVALWPVADRPYIGGSQTNSILELTLGYNGFGRLTGDETGSVGGSPGGGWGQTGIGRLFASDIGGQVAWLLPAALILLAAGLWITRRAPRTDRVRAAYLLWGGWLVVTAAVFSAMAGIFHAYYTVALAPAIAALVGMGAVALWARRRSVTAAATLAATVAITAVWSFVLLERSSTFLPWLRVVVLVAGLAAAALLLAHRWLPQRLGPVVAALGVLAALAGPAAYSIDTASTSHTGSIPSAGPVVAGARFGGPGGAFPGGAFPGGAGPAGVAPGGLGGTAGATGGGTTGGGPGFGTRGQLGGQTGGQGAPMGGLLDGSNPGDTLTALLAQDRGSYTWVAATIGANNASGYQLATGDPVMPIGGFNGSDPSPTLAQFQSYVAAGRIHYFIGGQGPGGGGRGGSNAAQEIAAWVQQNYTATTVDGVTVYDLTAGTSSSS